MTDSDTQIVENLLKSYLHDCRLQIGKNIRLLRRQIGYIQNQLMVIMKVSRSTISKLENGKFSFSINYLSKFLNFDMKLVNEN